MASPSFMRSEDVYKSQNSSPLSELDIWFGDSVSGFSVKVARSLAAALKDQSCQLRTLRIRDLSSNADDLIEILAEAFASPHCQLLELLCHFGRRASLSVRTTEYIEKILRSSICKLEKLSLYCDSTDFPNPELLADGLLFNQRLLSLDVVPSLPEAVSIRIAALVKRNQRLKDGELLDSPQAKPHTAKLFICGHERVGKTTVRKSLRRAKRPVSIRNPMDKIRNEPRTRGIELEIFTFGKRSLVVCDLAGQEEYHTFHHFFVTGSDKDLFLIVCREVESMRQQDFESRLQYWLRFIVSHRNPSMPKPKVMVLVNFFDSTADNDSRAAARTRSLVAQFQNDLDFGTTENPNIFGINAKKVRHLTPILDKLKFLLEQLLDSRPGIPTICDDLSVIMRPPNKLKSLRRGVNSGENSPYVRFDDILTKYKERFCKDENFPLRKTFKAALVELHNFGQIVYFQSDNEGDNEIVVADCGWFCHKLIGALLEPKVLRIKSQQERSWIWKKEDVLNILRRQWDADEHQLDQVLTYLKRLELVYPLHEEDFLIPALLSGTESAKWPERTSTEMFIFSGRRLECKDRDTTLLPSGVFTRLQARLHNAYPGNRSYKVGHGWISFVDDYVATIVRFGGETNRMEDRHWVDILVRRPKSQDEHEIKVENIISKVRTTVLEVCEGDDKGCPGISLQESAIKEHDAEELVRSSLTEVVELETLKKKILTDGITYGYPWSDGSSIKIADLLLPLELEKLATQDGIAVQRIAEEFQIDKEETFISCFKKMEKLPLQATSEGVPLTDELDALWQRIAKGLQLLDARDEERYQNIVKGIAHIRKDIGSLATRFTQVEKSILSSCADQLLKELRLVRQYQKGPLPAFLYFTNKSGTWHRLKGLLGEEAQLHIMCEWQEGPHPVENQPGVPVMISSREWLVRAAPVLIPAVKLFCCAARLAANIYLPGTQVFIPSPEWIDGFGLSGAEIQQEILPYVLNTFVDGVSNIEDIKPAQPDVSDAKLWELLKGKDIIMERDFKLHRVEFPEKGNILWVCEEHCKGEKLKNINPFSL